MQNKNQFYTKQSVITDPQQFVDSYSKLGETPEQLLQTVQNLVIHADLGKLYGVSFSKKQQNEELLRTVPQIVERIFEIDSRPLECSRNPEHRLVGMCRDYAVLLVSFMRSHGIASRVRVGFASYFDSTIPYEDEWLVEYFSEAQNRWIRMEAQIDNIQKEHYKIQFNTLDMKKDDGFVTGGEAWLLCRSGKKHQEDFGFNNSWKGWNSVKGNLLHDFNCLAGFELMPWDLWTEISSKKYSELSKQELALLDEIAEFTVRHDFTQAELQNIVKKLPASYFESIHSELSIMNIANQSETLDPDSLEQKIVFDSSCLIHHTEPQEKKQLSEIILTGGRQNNLKNITVTIPHNKLTVITGVSGSGKSSLAFDTIYAEGKRRYLDNMSSMVRMQEQVEKPDFDSLSGLTPTVAIEQKKGSQNPRSTVGTLTGIQDQLRMLFVAIGKPHCPFCGSVLEKDSKNKTKCPTCKKLFNKLTATSFNANSHVGACHSCNGLGQLYEVDEESVFSNPELSVLDGASAYFGKLRGKKRTGNWMVGELFAIADDRNINLDRPWKELPESFKKAVLYGTGDNKIYKYHYLSGGRDTELSRTAQGAVEHINRLFRETKSEDNPCMKFMRKNPCPVCNGEQLSIEARYTTVCGYRFPELLNYSVEKLLLWCHGIKRSLSNEDNIKVAENFSEIERKIENLLQVGLSYLTIARTAPSLSGGELQRVRLSSQLGSDLVGLTYILDEPSIGLHPRDHHLMIHTMKKLRDKGNTVIVVEHDKDTMLNADYIIDVGPGAGIHGGTIIAKGTVEQIKSTPTSLTGYYLKNSNNKFRTNPRKAKNWLTISGCCENNLKNVTARFPLGTMCCVTGASGSGKSTLIFDTLIPALEEKIHGRKNPHTNFTNITGYESLSDVIEMDQSPVGKTSRSICATYIGFFDQIRELFASLPESVSHGWDESYFSFNSKNGQCPVCEGQGQVKVSFQYMSDHYVTCPECEGNRYQEKILEITWHGKNIADILKMDCSEAEIFFSSEKEITAKLRLLDEVGLSYLKLGQSTATLSGGESQRLKIAKELGSRKKNQMLYILDEPTTGLHASDINRLLAIFDRLVNEGHTLLVIEHNMDVVRMADYVIDIGPDGGSAGGRIVASGTPEEISKNTNSVTGAYLA